MPAAPGMTSVAGRTAVGAGWMVAWRMTSRGLGFVSTIILARLLLPTDFGLMAMAISVTGAISYLSAIGVMDALIRRPDTGEAWFNTAFGFQALRALATAAIIAAGAHPAAAWFAEPRLVLILYVLAGTAALAGFESIGIVQYRRNIEFNVEFRLQMLPRLLQFCGVIGMVLVVRDYRAMLFGSVVFSVSRLVMSYWIHPWRPNLRDSCRLAHWRDLLGFSAWTWAAGLGSLVWERCDPFILGPALGTDALGRYLLAAEIAILPMTELVAPAMTVFYSGISAARQQGTDTSAIFPQLALSVLTVVTPIAIGFSATSGYIVTGLLGSQWQDVRPMIAVFALMGCVAPIAWTCNTMLVSEGKLRRSFTAITGSAILRVLAMAALVQAGQIAWAPTAALGVVVVEAALFLSQLRPTVPAPWRRHRGGVARLLLAAGVTAATLWASDLAWQEVSLGPIQALLAGGMLGAASIALFATVQFGLWWLGARPDGAERYIVSTIRSALARGPA